MISFIRGLLAEIQNDSLVIDLGGVGISVSVPISRLQPRPILNQEVFLHTYLQVREDAWTLYGFSDKEQLEMFRLLLSVSGIGAKTALAIVDKVNPQRFAAAIGEKDTKVFTAVSGVGKKSAERILLELKDKVDAFSTADAEAPLAAAETEALDSSLLAALKQLGYTATEARAFAMGAQEVLGPDASPEQLLRQALKIARTA
ncbi:MAG: Holliday junction branch migration protein RuvA [Firmicutes bacterium]|nr:Holliday junction branch migration protein RuvA [Bacillota bacterium]